MASQPTGDQVVIGENGLGLELSDAARMSTSPTTLHSLLAALESQSDAPVPRTQLYFKSSLTALSHAMEDQLLSMDDEHPLVIATFQQERFYRQEARRYERIASHTEQVYVMAAPDTGFSSSSPTDSDRTDPKPTNSKAGRSTSNQQDFSNRSGVYETIAFKPEDPLAQEWNLIVIGKTYSSCLICEERGLPTKPSHGRKLHLDPSRRFEGFWTFDRQISHAAAELLLSRIEQYRPELTDKIASARQQLSEASWQDNEISADPGPFAERLVTHLQAGQYKLLKAYRSIATKERQERLVNLITSSIRQSLDVDEVLQIAVEELGKTQDACRCLIYACGDGDRQVTLNHEYLSEGVGSLMGKTWQLEHNSLFQSTVRQEQTVYIDSVINDLRVQGSKYLKRWAKAAGIECWLLVPLTHKGQLLGMLELHYCKSRSEQTQQGSPWDKEDLALVGAIAPQIGVALIQARAYADLEKLNQQLSALEQTRYNLTAIVGHELRTPLATVKVCLESLASEPDMPPELRQVMVDTAVNDAERLRQLVEDFLMLSRLESGRVTLMPDAIALHECISLALSARRSIKEDQPSIENQVSESLPLIRADGEWLVTVLAKLLDNACKFTETTGKITLQAQLQGQGILDAPTSMLEVTISDTGRGIAPEQLEVIFERFYQEEGALRRSAGGTGLGLAICRQIITSLGGKIWATSPGTDKGTSLHFTLPLAQDERGLAPKTGSRKLASEEALLG